MNNLSNSLIKTILLAVFIVTPIFVFAQSEAGVIFLLIEPGSRAGGMGNAFVAQADDAFAQYWNPGAMAFNRRDQIALMHSNWLGAVVGLGDMYYEFLGWNRYVDDLQGNLGFQVTYITYGTQDQIDPMGKYIRTFNSYEIAAGSSYAYQVSENFGVGGTFKIIFSDLSPTGTGGTEHQKGQGLTYGFDLGLLKKNLFINGLNFGLNIQNIGPNITYIDNAQADPLPMNMRLGFSYSVFDSELSSLRINADMNKLLANDDFVLARLITAWYDDDGFMSRRERDKTIFNVGGEYVYWNLLSLRAGWIYDKAGEIIGPSFGAGIKHTFQNRFHAFIDFAMQQGGELLDFNQTFSVGLEF